MSGHRFNNICPCYGCREWRKKMEVGPQKLPQQCADCGGTGKTDDYWPGNNFQPPEWGTCETCAGLGIAPVEY